MVGELANLFESQESPEALHKEAARQEHPPRRLPPTPDHSCLVVKKGRRTGDGDFWIPGKEEGWRCRLLGTGGEGS